MRCSLLIAPSVIALSFLTSCASTSPVVSKVPGQPYYYAGAGYLNNFYYDQTNGSIIAQTMPDNVRVLRIDTDAGPVFKRLVQQGYSGLGYLAFSSTTVPSDHDLKDFAADKGADLVVMSSFFLRHEAVNQPVVSFTPGTTISTHSSGSGVTQGTANFNGQVGGSPFSGSSAASAYSNFAGSSTTTTEPQYSVQFVPGQAARCAYLIKLWKKTR
jgi:hypothetical protein